jgi:hypothetical protein
MNRREAMQTAWAIAASSVLPPLPIDDSHGGFLVPPEFVPALEAAMANPGVVLRGKPITISSECLTLEEVCRLRGVPFDG